MHTQFMAMARHDGLMARHDSDRRPGGASGDPPASETSLADGTGEGNAPIEGTSASSDPEVLAGAAGGATMTSLNDDDYPESLATGAGAVDDADEAARLADDSGTGDRQPRQDQDSTSGQARLPDEAAGVDLRPGSATPDRMAKP